MHTTYKIGILVLIAPVTSSTRETETHTAMADGVTKWYMQENLDPSQIET